eukprot:9322657-Pyramimonas_sp.AAC.2
MRATSSTAAQAVSSSARRWGRRGPSEMIPIEDTASHPARWRRERLWKRARLANPMSVSRSHSARESAASWGIVPASTWSTREGGG